MKPTYESIRKDIIRQITELQQFITDVNYWNGLPQAVGHACDIESERIRLHHLKNALSYWDDGKPIEAAEEILKAQQ